MFPNALVRLTGAPGPDESYNCDIKLQPPKKYNCNRNSARCGVEIQNYPRKRGCFLPHNHALVQLCGCAVYKKLN